MTRTWVNKKNFCVNRHFCVNKVYGATAGRPEPCPMARRGALVNGHRADGSTSFADLVR